MNWKMWKRAFVVALLTGVLGGVVTIGIVKAITMKELLFVLIFHAAKDGLLYLKAHPVDTVLDTTFVKKPTEPNV